jgi:haloalkane dehalogenase
MLTWTLELPIEGQPEDVVRIVESYAKWLSTNKIPKLFIDADPGALVIGAQREFCRAWPSQETVQIKAAHFLQETSAKRIAWDE